MGCPQATCRCRVYGENQHVLDMTCRKEETAYYSAPTRSFWPPSLPSEIPSHDGVLEGSIHAEVGETGLTWCGLLPRPRTTFLHDLS